MFWSVSAQVEYKWGSLESAPYCWQLIGCWRLYLGNFLSNWWSHAGAFEMLFYTLWLQVIVAPINEQCILQSTNCLVFHKISVQSQFSYGQSKSDVEMRKRERIWCFMSQMSKIGPSTAHLCSNPVLNHFLEPVKPASWPWSSSLCTY